MASARGPKARNKPAQGGARNERSPGFAPAARQAPKGRNNARAIHLYNRQRTVRFDLPWLRRFAPVALADCEGEGIVAGSPLESLEEIEVSIVSDRAIAAVHRRFMDIAGATDVLTFEHGEIIISAATAERHARAYGHPLEHEVGLYIIHGILHLNGHDDLAEPAASRMKETQEAVLRRVLGMLSATR
jgi:probable rRNA maturation factor